MINKKIQIEKQIQRNREYLVIALSLAAIIIFTYLETQMINLPNEVPLSSSILVFILVNLNILLLLLLIFFIFRNLFKFTVEQKAGVWGTRLRTKLIGTFILLSLVPTILLFFATFQFLGTSIDYWFSNQLEKSLIEGLEVNYYYNKEIIKDITYKTKLLAIDIEKNFKEPLSEKNKEELKNFLKIRLAYFDLTAIRLYNADLKEIAYVSTNGIKSAQLQPFPLDLVTRSLTLNQPLTHLQSSSLSDYIAAIQPLNWNNRKIKIEIITVFKSLQKGTLAKLSSIRQDLESYRQLKNLKNPIYTNQYITLSIVTLLIIFAATWFGFHLAKSITIPLMEIVQGAQRIAIGDYNVFIDRESYDEIGILVNVFNRMTAKLKITQVRLNKAQSEMNRAYLELDQRRRYMEIILRNIAAGVVTIDSNGIITSFNPSAERLLKITETSIIGHHWNDIMLNKKNLEILKHILTNFTLTSRSIITRQIYLTIDNKKLTFVLQLSILRNELGQKIGIVVVFEDLTELEKTQSIAAWKKIAQYVKYKILPLLIPIKFSTKIITQQYQDKLNNDIKKLKINTYYIIYQIKTLKNLIKKFILLNPLHNNNLTLIKLPDLIEKKILLFKYLHPNIYFEKDIEKGIPSININQKTICKVINILLNNAVISSLETKPPYKISLHLSYDEIYKVINLEIEDTGLGITSKNYPLSLYNFSKKNNFYLEIETVSEIIKNYNGYIRTENNEPQGTRIIIEIPTKDN